MTIVNELAKFAVSPDNKEQVRNSAELLIKEAKDNGYKASVTGIEVFLNNCDGGLTENAKQYYRFAVALNVDLLTE